MFLQRAGIDSVIYEGRAEPRDELGAFLGLAPNGRDVLGSLGIREEIEALGLPSPKIAFLNHRGKELGVNPQPVVTFKRGELSRGLRDAAIRRGIEVRWGHRFVGLEQRGDTVLARFADGSTAEGDFVVGCDGIESDVRRSVFPAAPEPTYTGVIGSGAYTRLPGLRPTAGTMYMTFCLNGFFGYQVADDGEVYWFENVHQRAAPRAGELNGDSGEWKRKLVELHRPDHAPIVDIIASTEMEIVRYPVFEMPTLPQWHAGRVVLVGDSAHATGPHSGQGGSLAFEDSIVLAMCLRDLPSVPEAFARYQQIRKERVEYVVQETRRTGNQKTPPGLFGRTIRDLVLPIFLRKGVDTAAGIHRLHIDWDDVALVRT
jgi:2-polyprenyl-6-methoxyphenol hydroxylase-like FAD-dependent oxidoreductase